MAQVIEKTDIEETSAAYPGRQSVKLRRACEVLIDIIERQGVEVIFGIPGGASIPIYDALVDSSMKSILVRHEQGCGRNKGEYGNCDACLSLLICA